MWETEYYSSHKKCENLPCVTTRMELEGTMQSEISQMEKANHLKISLIHRR